MLPIMRDGGRESNFVTVIPDYITRDLKDESRNYLLANLEILIQGGESSQQSGASRKWPASVPDWVVLQKKAPSLWSPGIILYASLAKKSGSIFMKFL